MKAWWLAPGLFCATAAAWQAPAPPQQPTFRTGVEVVRLDVNVLDRDRRPIRGLRREDFIVLVDGIVQPLVEVAEVDYSSPRPVAAAVPSVPEGFVSNHEPEHRRAFIIVLDDAMSGPRAWSANFIRQAARAFVAGLAPDDLVAVVYTERSVHNQELTTDRALVLQAIDQFRPTRPGHVLVSLPRVQETIAHVRTLRQAVARLSEVPHIRGAVLLLSPGVESMPDDEGTPVEGRGMGVSDLLAGIEMSSLGQAAYGRVPVHTIHSAGLVGWQPLQGRLGTPRFTQQDYMRLVADQSGGYAHVNRNDYESGVAQILAESSHHYVVGYQPTFPVQDGRYRRLDVRVTHGDATIFPSGRHFRSPRPPQHVVEPSARTAIAGIVPVADISLAVRATPGGRVSRRGPIRVRLELLTGPLERAGGEGEIECAAFGAGNLAQAGTVTGRVDLQAGDAPVRATLDLDLRPGRYNLRCGLHAPALGQSASVYTTLTVR